MINKPDFEASRKRLEAYWDRQLLDRCCMAMQLPKGDVPLVRNAETVSKTADDDGDYRSNYMDGERMLKRSLARFENTQYFGDAFPVIFPGFGTSGHAKYFHGANYEFGRDTVWYHASIDDLAARPPVYDPASPIYAEEQAVMRYLADEADGRYMLSMPDNCGMIDALAGLRGNAALLTDMVDEPEAVETALARILEGFMASIGALFDIAADACFGGSSQGWMYTFCSGRHLQMQVDFAAMISPAMFRRFAVPELTAVANSLDRAIYHLDGQEQIRHLDALLSIENISAIQWTAVAGQPKTSQFIDVLKRIQAAGKCLILMPHADEVETLLTELSSAGLQMVVHGVRTPDEAQALLKMAEKLSHA